MSPECDFDRLESLVVGELARGEASRVRAHAAECNGCGRELASLSRTRAHLAGPHRRVPERINHLYPAIAERVTARRSVRRQLGAMAVTLASLCAVIVISTAGERARSVEHLGHACGLQCSEPPICELPRGIDDEIDALEQRFAACLIATPGQQPN